MENKSILITNPTAEIVELLENNGIDFAIQNVIPRPPARKSGFRAYRPIENDAWEKIIKNSYKIRMVKV